MDEEARPLQVEQTTLLLETIEQMRAAGAEDEREVCGWQLSYSRRGAGMRGDLVAVDPVMRERVMRRRGAGARGLHSRVVRCRIALRGAASPLGRWLPRNS